MLKKTIIVIIIVLLSIILCGFNLSAKAEGNSGKNFILPKTFKINDKFLPPLDAKTQPAQNKTVSTGTIQVKVYKPNSVVTSTPVKNTPPAVYKQPSSIVTKTPAKNNNAKSSTVQTNPIKINTANKANNSASLTNLIKNYECAYADTLKSTIIALSAMGITPESYNTERGQIVAKLPSGKEIFILVVPSNNGSSTNVRITPTDGNYNLPMITINEIFSNIGGSLP